jgi:thiamine-monophosphate kinase
MTQTPKNMGEFEFIQQMLPKAQTSPQLILGIGDDAAIIRPNAGRDIHVSSDMLVAGRHFFADVAPQNLGHKALAVNLSDMAAMGAKPRWVLLSVALPELNPVWLADFLAGFQSLAAEHEVMLIGGDTTAGPLTVSVTVLGDAQQGQALRRDQAQVGDDIWVSGELGLAAMALAHLTQTLPWTLDAPALALCLAKLHQPTPRVALGMALQGIAHAALDISDGLLADLGHILQASACGAVVNLEALPVAECSVFGADFKAYSRYVAAGGDDYELCFTAPVEQRAALADLAQALNIRLSKVGHITAEQGLQLQHCGQPFLMAERGFDHFKAP